MAKAPESVEIRPYQVGFGDCFLLSFVYSKTDKRHVLIDFGTTALPSKLKTSFSEHMSAVAKQIKTDCGGKLTGLVATHRHADHISGFGTDTKTGKSGDIIASCEPDVVLQPWTEDPAAAKDATTASKGARRTTKGFVQALNAMQSVAERIYEIAEKKPAWLGKELYSELRFLGQDGIKNRSAVENLIRMGKANVRSRTGTGAPGKAKAIFANYGSDAGLSTLLPGVKVRVLGPPTLKQSEKIKKMRRADADEFWLRLDGSARTPEVGMGHLGTVGGTRRRSTSLPPEARWLVPRLERLRGEQLLSIVRTLDDSMNNTSLILLFEVGGKKLLFPGDAQIENWTYALVDAPEREDNRKLLTGVHVYKVGHHGSLNATPKALLWPLLQKRSGAGRLKSLISTLPGKHGKTKSQTEVPRRTLMRALEASSDVTNTSAYKWTKENRCLAEAITIKV